MVSFGGFNGDTGIPGYPNSWMVYFMENPTKVDDMKVPSVQETSISASNSWAALQLEILLGFLGFLGCTPKVWR